VYITTLVLVGCLVWSEVKYFVSPPHKLAFLPDTDFEAKLQINVDMTIAMPCDCKWKKLGSDVMILKIFSPFFFKLI
jgi:hypothetical protein